MKFAFALVAMVLVSSSAFAADVCGTRTKSIPLVGSVEYKYSHKGNIIHIDITQLSGLGASTMISTGLHEGVNASVPADEAAKVNALFDSTTIKVGTKVVMEVVGAKTVVEINDKRGEYSANLLPNLAKYIENKLSSGDGGSRIEACK